MTLFCLMNNLGSTDGNILFNINMPMKVQAAAVVLCESAPFSADCARFSCYFTIRGC